MQLEMSDASADAPLRGARVAVVYDCFFPLTVGGAERWYRLLSEALSEAGASVTYLTRRQWEVDPPELGRIELVAVSPSEDLYDDQGVRKLAPGLRFGLGVFRHLLRHRHDFDVVQLANFPFWSIIGARLALVGSKVPVVIDWHEVWSFRFWRAYAGLPVGLAGFAVQRLCIALTTMAVTTSTSNAARLVQAGARGEPIVLPGYLPPEASHRRQDPEPTAAADPPYVLFAGRHIFDKGIDLLPGLADELGRLRPGVELVVAGDGPGRPGLEAALATRASRAHVRLIGFVDDQELERLMRSAACLVVPSRREGYGMVLVEATSYGTPVVVADFDENLATHHIDEGRNGFVATPPTPARLAERVLAAIDGGIPLRRSTLGWYRNAARSRTIQHSVRDALAVYQRLMSQSWGLSVHGVR